MLENMNKFRDVRGGLWAVVLTDHIVSTVDEIHGIDLTEETNGLLDPDTPIQFKRRVLFTVISDSIKRRGLNEFSVQELFDDGATLCGIEALTWAAVDFNDYEPEARKLMKETIDSYIRNVREVVSLEMKMAESKRKLAETKRILDRIEAGVGLGS